MRLSAIIFSLASTALLACGGQSQLSIIFAADGGGTVSAGDRSCSQSCELNVGRASVSLVAEPDELSVFTGWSGACSGSDACDVLAPARVTASFERIAKRVRIEYAGDGTGEVSFSSGPVCTGSCEVAVPLPEALTLIARPGPGSRFVGWSGACDSQTERCELVSAGDAALTAHFAFVDAVDLSIKFAGSGRGRVYGALAAIDCASNCSATVKFGNGLTLVAEPTPGSIFTGWSVGGCGASPSCSFEMLSSGTVTVRFEALREIQVSATGTGSGSFESSAFDGGSCSASCTTRVPDNASVTVTARPSPASEWRGWSGACSGQGMSCTLTATDDLATASEFHHLFGFSAAFGPNAQTRDLAIVDDNSVLFCGFHNADVDFGGGPLPATVSTSHSFIAKLNADGGYEWSTAFTTTPGKGVIAENIELMPDGGAVVVGYFSGELRAGAFSQSSVGSDDAFVARLGEDGTVLALQTFGTAGRDLISSLDIDTQGNVVVGGFFSGQMAVGTTTLQSANIGSGWVARFDAQLVPVWAVPADGSVSAVRFLSNGDIAVAAYSYATVNLGCGAAASPNGYGAAQVAILTPAGACRVAKDFVAPAGAPSGGFGSVRLTSLVAGPGTEFYGTLFFRGPLQAFSAMYDATAPWGAASLLFRLDDGASPQWVKHFSSPVTYDAVIVEDLALRADGQQLLAVGRGDGSLNFGAISTFCPKGWDLLGIALNPTTGESTWAGCYGTTSGAGEVAVTVAPLPDGGYAWGGVVQEGTTLGGETLGRPGWFQGAYIGRIYP